MYKKLLLAFVSIIAIQTAKAQTEKGSQMLGASFIISTTSSDIKALNPGNNTYELRIHEKLSYYNIAPTYSYFIADKLDIGVSVGYTHVSQKDDVVDVNGSDFSNKTNGFSGAVYLRKYFLYENKIGIRTGPFFDYEHSNTTQSSYNDPENDNHANTYTGGVGLDFVYFPVKKLGLSAGIGNLNYSHRTAVAGSNDASKITSNSFNLNFANSLTLSVNYVFGK